MVAFYRAETLTTQNSVGYVMRRAHSLMRVLLEAAFEREEINFSQWAALVCLRDGVARTAADISRCLSHDSGSLTRLIDQLEGRNLLQRRSCPHDRRVYELVLTPEGQAMLRALTPAVADIYNQVLADFTRPEIETLLRLLHKVMAGAESLIAQHGAADGSAAP